MKAELFQGLASRAVPDAVHQRGHLVIDALRREHATIRMPEIGELGYYVDAREGGTPVLLLHSVHSGGSSYEMLPLFQALRATRTIYALDLPGCGTSIEQQHVHERAHYRDAVSEFTALIAKETGRAPDVIALGNAAEFAAAVSVLEPLAMRSIVLISPTGLDSQQHSDASATGIALETVSKRPLLGRVAQLLLRETDELEAKFAGRVDEGLRKHVKATKRHPTSRFLSAATVGHRLGTAHASTTLYARLRVPTLIIYDECPRSDFARLGELCEHSSEVRVRRITPTRGMPHFERRAEVVKVIEAFYEDRGLTAHERESRPSVDPLSAQPELLMSVPEFQGFPREVRRPHSELGESPDTDE